MLCKLAKYSNEQLAIQQKRFLAEFFIEAHNAGKDISEFRHIIYNCSYGINDVLEYMKGKTFKDKYTVLKGLLELKHSFSSPYFSNSDSYRHGCLTDNILNKLDESSLDKNMQRVFNYSIEARCGLWFLLLQYKNDKGFLGNMLKKQINEIDLATIGFLLKRYYYTASRFWQKGLMNYIDKKSEHLLSDRLFKNILHDLSERLEFTLPSVILKEHWETILNSYNKCITFVCG